MSAHSFIYLGSKKYGEGRMGLTATPIYNITKDTNVTELEDTMHSDNRMMPGFFLRSKGYDSAEGLSKLRTFQVATTLPTPSSAAPARMASLIGHPTLRVSAVLLATSRTTSGARALRYKMEFTSDAEPGGRPRGRPLSSRWPEGAKSGACPARAIA